MAKDKKKKKHRALWIYIKIQVVLILLVIGAITYFYVGGYANTIKALRNEAVFFVDKSRESTFRSTQTSIAYDANNEVLSVMKGEKDLYYLLYDEIPIYAKEAIISIEDKKFYHHHGVDYKAIVRAAWAMFRNGKVTQGGSTITQQLSRNVFLTQEKTWERKIEEIYIAINMEKRYSKEQILEFYLNNIYFSNGYYGIEAASRGYFNKPATGLSLSQIAFLCAIPNNPNLYDPLDNMNHTIVRRNLILRNMHEDGIISLMEYQSAMIEEIVINQPKPQKHNYEETYTYYCATRALMEVEGFEFRTEFDSEESKAKYNQEYEELYKECNSRLYTGGYRIYTSLDMDMQRELQGVIDKELKPFDEVSDEGIYSLQSAGVCIDNETGFVKAIVGGRSQEYEGYTLNRAYQSFRQPGSAIKPLIIYTPALERDYTADTVVEDNPIEDGPVNADGSYSGNISFRKAVEYSKNTVAYNLIEELSPETALSYLKEMGFTHIEDTDITPAIALGGFTYGVSPLEMAEGYAAIENNGFYREATCILKITDANGNSIYQPNRVRTVVYNDEAAWQMTDILKGVLTEGTGKGLGVPGMPSAGKTGTTNDNKDGWFVGYTPYYTCSIWVGYDIPRELPDLKGSTYPGKIWNRFMASIHKKLEPKEFSRAIYGYEYNKIIEEKDKKEQELREQVEEDKENGTEDKVIEETITDVIQEIPSEEEEIEEENDATELIPEDNGSDIPEDESQIPLENDTEGDIEIENQEDLETNQNEAEGTGT